MIKKQKTYIFFNILPSLTLILLLGWCPLIKAEENHENKVYFYFFDQNNNPIEVENSDLSITFGENDITSGQNPDNHSPAWHHHDNSAIYLEWDVGRHKSSDPADSFQTALMSENGSLPPMLTLGINDQNNTYYAKDLNFWIEFTIEDIDLGNGITVDIPNLITAQGSTDFFQTLLTIFKDIKDTIFDAGEFIENIAAEDPDLYLTFNSGLKTFDDASATWQEIKELWENNWYLGQSMESVTINIPTQTNELTATEDNDDPVETLHEIESYIPAKLPDGSDTVPLVVTALYSDSSISQTPSPVNITPGSDDHSFNINIFIPQTSANGSTTLFANTPQVSGNTFVDPSIGIFTKYPGTTWIETLNHGWCYPSGDYNPGLWIYSSDEDDWYYVNSNTPGALYKNRTEIWYEYDPLTVRFYPILD